MLTDCIFFITSYFSNHSKLLINFNIFMGKIQRRRFFYHSQRCYICEHINTMDHHPRREVTHKLTEINKLNNELTTLSSRLDNRDEEFENLQHSFKNLQQEVERL
ncbi:10920_t:CDS:2 [Funneliformis geosporum]|nr:10920_t:CDS:2 [Funneliformis geosporum]